MYFRNQARRLGRLFNGGISDQEMPIFGPLQAIWEGTCILTGQEILPNNQIISLEGKGFMELVGYLL